MIAVPVLRSEYPLIVQDKIERLWRMAFGPTFPAPFSKTFSTIIAVSAGVITLIQDTFTDTNGVLLPNHVIAPINIPATVWTSRAGTWNIQSNDAELTASFNNAIATCVSGKADCVISADVASESKAAGTERDTGIIARYTNSSNYWSIGVNCTASLFRIVETNAGVVTTRASTTHVIPYGVVHVMEVTLSGSTITATLDGSDTISYASATLNQTVTTHGIRSRTAGINEWIDNFIVIG